MAKLEIFNSKVAVKESVTPLTSTLALPFSLATQRGAAITAVAKSIADIQKDMYAIEDQNNYNKALPELSLEVQKKYTKYKDSYDTNAPNKLIKDLQPSNFKKFLEGQSGPVQKLLKNKLAESASLLVPKLNGQISTNNIERFTVGLGESFDNAIFSMISSDQEEVAIGTITFDNLIKNKAYANYLGDKAYAALVKSKTSLKYRILLNKKIKINPLSFLKNQEALEKAVGVEASKEYIEKAKITRKSNRAEKDKRIRLDELKENDNIIGAFTDVMLRIDNFQKNKLDENAKNEMPTINELYSLYEDGFLNEAMLVKISAFLTEDDQDGLTDSELYREITTQIYSAKTIYELDDIKKSYILNNNALKNMAMEDVGQFNAIIARAKTDFKSHKDYQFYSKLINANIRNISNVRGKKALAIAAAIANKEQFILQSYNAKVIDGMSPENAYLTVLNEDFNEDHIPNLSHLPFPNKQVDWAKALTDISYFDLVANESLETFKKSNKSTFNAKRLIDDLDKIDFARDIFKIRMMVAPGKDHTEKLTWATQVGINTSKPPVYDPNDK